MGLGPALVAAKLWAPSRRGGQLFCTKQRRRLPARARAGPLGARPQCPAPARAATRSPGGRGFEPHRCSETRACAGELDWPDHAEQRVLALAASGTACARPAGPPSPRLDFLQFDFHGGGMWGQSRVDRTWARQTPDTHGQDLHPLCQALLSAGRRTPAGPGASQPALPHPGPQREGAQLVPAMAGPDKGVAHEGLIRPSPFPEVPTIPSHAAGSRGNAAP
ncbi:uncharacterized protein [Castor canadensis]|uniref:Uncharacterized protein LOC109700848 n=1 Tax=Castor canadensis TaxID=51338 RepID=A0A8B7WC75_CASCN|nr:uncharacterized protein LOC109700848 [Castor canadensis]